MPLLQSSQQAPAVHAAATDDQRLDIHGRKPVGVLQYPDPVVWRVDVDQTRQDGVNTSVNKRVHGLPGGILQDPQGNAHVGWQNLCESIQHGIDWWPQHRLSVLFGVLQLHPFDPLVSSASGIPKGSDDAFVVQTNESKHGRRHANLDQHPLRVVVTVRSRRHASNDGLSAGDWFGQGSHQSGQILVESP